MKRKGNWEYGISDASHRIDDRRTMLEEEGKRGRGEEEKRRREENEMLPVKSWRSSMPCEKISILSDGSCTRDSHSTSRVTSIPVI